MKQFITDQFITAMNEAGSRETVDVGDPWRDVSLMKRLNEDFLKTFPTGKGTKKRRDLCERREQITTQSPAVSLFFVSPSSNS